MGTTSFLGFFITSAILQLPLRPRLSTKEALLRDLRIGGWPSASTLIRAGFAQLLPWYLAMSRGIVEVASLQAMMSIGGITNPITISSGNVLLPHIAKSDRQMSVLGALKRHLSVIAPSIFLIPTTLIAIGLLASPVISLLYGPSNPYQSSQGLLRLLCINYGLNFVVQLVSTALNGLARTRVDFLALVVATTCGIVVAFAAIPAIGAYGAATAFIVSNVVRIGLAIASDWNSSYPGRNVDGHEVRFGNEVQ